MVSALKLETQNYYETIRSIVEGGTVGSVHDSSHIALNISGQLRCQLLQSSIARA